MMCLISEARCIEKKTFKGESTALSTLPPLPSCLRTADFKLPQSVVSKQSFLSREQENGDWYNDIHYFGCIKYDFCKHSYSSEI